MNVCEMVALADQNGKTYESIYGTYSRENGFRTIGGASLSNIVRDNDWKLKEEKKKMTKEEIEKALGYEIEIVGDESKKQKEELSNLEEQLYEQLVNVLFGIRRK